MILFCSTQMYDIIFLDFPEQSSHVILCSGSGVTVSQNLSQANAHTLHCTLISDTHKPESQHAEEKFSSNINQSFGRNHLWPRRSGNGHIILWYLSCNQALLKSYESTDTMCIKKPAASDEIEGSRGSSIRWGNTWRSKTPGWAFTPAGEPICEISLPSHLSGTPFGDHNWARDFICKSHFHGTKQQSFTPVVSHWLLVLQTLHKLFLLFTSPHHLPLTGKCQVRRSHITT